MQNIATDFNLSKFLLCVSSQGQDLYSYQKLNVHLRAVTDADDADNAGRHSTTTTVTYRQ